MGQTDFQRPENLWEREYPRNPCSPGISPRFVRGRRFHVNEPRSRKSGKRKRRKLNICAGNNRASGIEDAEASIGDRRSGRHRAGRAPSRKSRALDLSSAGSFVSVVFPFPISAGRSLPLFSFAIGPGHSFLRLNGRRDC